MLRVEVGCVGVGVCGVGVGLRVLVLELLGV